VAGATTTSSAMPAKQRCSFITCLPRPSTLLPLPASKLSRNLDPLRGDQMRWANWVPPKPEAETDGGDDGKFHSAHPRGGNVDLRQVCRDLVYGTADHTRDESIHSSILPGIHRSRAKRSTFKAKLNGGLR
jgi:hypothetical protein